MSKRAAEGNSVVRHGVKLAIANCPMPTRRGQTVSRLKRGLDRGSDIALPACSEYAGIDIIIQEFQRPYLTN